MSYQRERKEDELREINITRNYTKFAEGSVLIETGETKVICTVSVEDGVPYFLRGKGKGWLTAEYSLLPGSTPSRSIRASSKGKVSGRTKEIQRLIGRSLRAIIDLDKIGERTLWIDCDVIQADGGTRTASVTGAYIALVDAINDMIENNIIDESPLTDYLAAVSAGIVKGKPLLDLCYEEDFAAQVDMNVVMTGEGEVVEVQGTAEEDPFTREEMTKLLDLAEKGINNLIEKQKESLKEVNA